MSNTNNLPITGFRYIIDDSELNAVAQRIQKQLDDIAKRGPEAAKALAAALDIYARAADITFNQKTGQYVDNATKKIISNAEAIARTRTALTQLGSNVDKIDKATSGNNLDASTRSIRVFTSELVNLSGAGGQATSIITGLLAATGPLDVALVGAAATILAAKTAWEEYNKSVDVAIARNSGAARSFGEFIQLRQQVSAQRDFLNLILESAKGINGLSEFGPSTNAAQFLQRYTAQQAELAQTQYLAGVAARVQAADINTSINAMIKSSATIDQLILKYAELSKLQQQFGLGASAGFQALAQGAVAHYQAIQSRERSTTDTKGLEFLNPFASNLAQDYLQAQQQYQEQSQAALQNHNDRLADIDAQGAEARARIARSGAQARANIERSYQRQIQDINENLADARVAAAENLAERIADAEANAQERRVQIDEQLADRRVSIEENYQERIQQINEEYGSSVLDAVANRDAFALLRAQQQKARALKDAEQQRQKELADAQKEHDKQAKELEAALSKQKAALEKDYEKRIKDLEDNAAKQRQKAAEGRDQQLADQKQSEADQLADQQSAEAAARASEKKSYDQRQTQLEQAYAARKAALIAALAEEKGITESQAKAIIESLKGILNPDQITELLQDLQKAIQAKIEVTVTPFSAEKHGGKGGPGTDTGASGGNQGFAYGGFTGAMGGVVHPHEWVIPNPAIAGYDRWQQVVSGFLSHASRTVQMPGRGGGGGEAHSLDVSISLDNNLLNAQVANSTMRTMVRVNRGATR